MDRLWGISSAGFLALYAVLLVAPTAVSWVWADRQARRQRVRTPERTTPGLYQLAWVAGGATRTVETAIAVLLDGGCLRVDSSGSVHRTADSVSRTDSFERRVLEACDGVSSAAVIKRVRKASACLDLGRAAERGGLVVSARSTGLRRAVVLVLYVVVLIIGLVRIGAGLVEGHPVGLLALLLVPAIIAVAWSAAILVRAQPRRTVRGRRALAAVRSDLSSGRRSTAPFARSGSVAAVLFGGFAAHPDEPIRTALSHIPGGGSSYAYGYDNGNGGGGACGTSCSTGGGGGCGGGT